MLFYHICREHGVHVRTCKICRPVQATTNRLRKVVRGALLRKGLQKNSSTLKILGARSWNEVLTMIQKKIKTYNQMFPKAQIKGNDFVLDHIKPVSKFDVTDSALCNHYTNLQPLPPMVNAKKSGKWDAKSEKFWRKNIILKKNNFSIFLPIGCC